MKPTRLIAAMNLTKPIFAEVLIAPAHLFEANAAEYMFFMFYSLVNITTNSA